MDAGAAQLARDDAQTRDVNNKIKNYVSAVVNANIKLKQQNNKIHRENALLKAELAGVLRWR